MRNSIHLTRTWRQTSLQLSSPFQASAHKPQGSRQRTDGLGGPVKAAATTPKPIADMIRYFHNERIWNHKKNKARMSAQESPLEETISLQAGYVNTIRERALINAPQPGRDYLQQAFNRPFAKEQPQKLLIILDLNGTILVRPRRNKSQFVRRPFLDEFLASCLLNHTVMVWSSARLENVTRMVKGISTEEQQAQFAAVWDRAHLRLDSKAYKEKVQVYKCLTWVWDDEGVQEAHPHAANGGMWDQTNTILIDDSYLKASSEPFNHIEVPEFTEDMAPQETPTPVLKELLRYIEEASYYEDVSTFIRATPFAMPNVNPEI